MNSNRFILDNNDPRHSHTIPGLKTRALLTEWMVARNDCADEEVLRTDARYAQRLGDDVLAALCYLRDGLERAGGKVQASEISLTVGEIIEYERGRLNEEIRKRTGTHDLAVPGIARYSSNPERSEV